MVKSHELKYGFCNKSFRKDEPLTIWTLLQHIYPHFWPWLLLYSAITPKSEDKYVVKVFNWSEVHLSEMICYKIHTLISYFLHCTYTANISVVIITIVHRVHIPIVIWLQSVLWMVVILITVHWLQFPLFEDLNFSDFSYCRL